MNIALAQTQAQLGDVRANIENALNMICRAAKLGADLVLLPELCFTGYQLDLLGERIFSLSDEWQERIDTAMGEAAAKYGLYIVAGLCRREGDLHYNAAALYDRSGKRAGEYRKMFAFAKERDYFAPGRELPVFDTDFGKIGILICYDIGFPELSRRLAVAGAQLLLFPAAWRAQDELPWNLNVPSRALENQCFTAAVNHGGVYGDLRLFGRSMVCGPDGRAVLQLGYDDQMLGVCSVDLDKSTQLRAEPGYYTDYQASAVIGPHSWLTR